MKNNNPLEVAFNLKNTRYQDAIVAFAAGSIFRGEGSPTSDIDLVVLYNDPFDDIRRETIKAEGWIVEVFIHNIQAQNYFFEQDRKRGLPIMMNMVFEGTEVPGPCALSHQQKAEAKRIIDLGPPPLSEIEMQRMRYTITNLLDDLQGVSKDDERYAVLGELFVDLANFHLRASNKWSGVGKGLSRALRRYAPEVAQDYFNAFNLSYRDGKVDQLIKCADNILIPYGGRLLYYEEKAGDVWKNFGK